MKKTLVILALIAMVVLPVCAKGEIGAGVEAGTFAGITGTYKIDEKLTGFASLSYAYVGDGVGIGGSVGAQYKVTEFSIESAKFDVNAGGLVGLGLSNKVFHIDPMACASVSYDFSIEDLDFTTYFRLGLGASLLFSKEFKVGFPAFSAALGLVLAIN